MTVIFAMLLHYVDVHILKHKIMLCSPSTEPHRASAWGSRTTVWFSGVKDSHVFSTDLQHGKGIRYFLPSFSPYFAPTL